LNFDYELRVGCDTKHLVSKRMLAHVRRFSKPRGPAKVHTYKRKPKRFDFLFGGIRLGTENKKTQQEGNREQWNKKKVKPPHTELRNIKW
jgi:hypothetical protein